MFYMKYLPSQMHAEASLCLVVDPLDEENCVKAGDIHMLKSQVPSLSVRVCVCESTKGGSNTG